MQANSAMTADISKPVICTATFCSGRSGRRKFGFGLPYQSRKPSGPFSRHAQRASMRATKRSRYLRWLAGEPVSHQRHADQLRRPPGDFLGIGGELPHSLHRTLGGRLLHLIQEQFQQLAITGSVIAAA